VINKKGYKYVYVIPAKAGNQYFWTIFHTLEGKVRVREKMESIVTILCGCPNNKKDLKNLK